MPQAIRAMDSETGGRPRVVQQDDCRRPAGRLGGGTARCAQKIVLAAEAATLCPSNFSQLTVSEYLRTQPWMDQARPSARCTRNAVTHCWRQWGTLAARDLLDCTDGRLLLVGDAAGGAGRRRDAAAGRRRPRGLRTGYGVFFCSRAGPGLHAAVLRRHPPPERITEGSGGWPGSWKPSWTSCTRSEILPFTYRRGPPPPVPIWPEEVACPLSYSRAACPPNVTCRCAPAGGWPRPRRARASKSWSWTSRLAAARLARGESGRGDPAYRWRCRGRRVTR